MKGAVKMDTGSNLLLISKDDHIIVLKDDGLVYAMGDDTFGQCGQDDKTRNTHPPFVENRIKYPVQVVYFYSWVEKYQEHSQDSIGGQS